jgi:tripartite-type tricarboxylate transporter receptor subunit TctC
MKMRGKISFIKKGLVLAFIGISCLTISFEGLLAVEKFPEKPIKILVGFVPGGTVDLNARMLGSLVSEDFGQAVVVVNKPGATATIAAAELASSKPDGYTLMLTPILTVSLTPFFIKIKYDPLKSFDPILSTFATNYGLCVRQDAPWKTFREMIEWAQKNPGELSVSDTGKGSPHYPTFEIIARKEKIQWKHVPYPGGLPAATALLGGHVKAHFGSGSHLPFLESGQFKMLAAYSPKRQPKFPDVPTLKELGYDVPDSRTHIILAPKGVPEPILKILEDAFGKAVKHDAYKGFLKNIFLEPDYRNREEIKSLIEAEYKAWDELLEKLGLKVK